MKIKSKNEQDTYILASKIASLLNGGEIILLNGDLGAGKTTFVKGIAKALNINEVVTSPTFTLLKTYSSEKFTLVHVDAYRLDGSSFDELYDYLNNDNVIFIEWSSCLANTDFLQEYLSISITYKSKNQREFDINAKGKRYLSFLKEFDHNV
ncbi:MAG: tRNA (adenosine(37)-N6)-threonylcarbamoyltransferase complex ATPase subunit type 1 TsaE [Erysipelotrichaceae bacterium]|nr:tRNA (adenosine(37)-N6)-threonylcarbamoyltransferase complex ATPase subunit type 1 TsaE [Erysipelotrichaceae bacterium]